MTERLPRATYDKLARSIWDLGRVSMTRMISIAPIPAYVKGEIDMNGEVLEPEFFITNKEDFQERLPEVVALTVNAADTFIPDPSFTMYTWQRVLLNIRHHTHEFDYGMILMDDDGRTINPQLQMPPDNKRRRRGTQAWRTMQAESNLHIFDAPMAEEFTETATRFREHILKNNNS